MGSEPAEFEALFSQRLLICVGPGGVGKTTTAAALAIAMAQRGRATAVLTVDPARRLKDALGFDSLSSDPRPVAVGGDAAPLDALALDTKRTFDRMVTRLAPTPEIAARILANRLYREISGELGGSTEYMAMEKLHELLAPGRYDCVVVDTPPSADLRDLLAAPLRMTELLASQAVDFLKSPASIITGAEPGLMRMTLGAVIRTLERWTGGTLLSELADFVAGFEHLIEGFRAQAHAIEDALHAADTRFLIVTTPERQTLEATRAFEQALRAGRYPVAGVIANRVHVFPHLDTGAGAGIPAPLRRKLVANYEDFAALAARDAAALGTLRAHGSTVLTTLPMFEDAPASLVGLRAVAALLAAGAPAPVTSRRGVPSVSR
jgi:anion-transporting  ArsA/GET3 family ATPase